MSIAGDVWNIRTDHVITGVTGALKIIDDILSQAIDVEEIEVRLRTVLNRCRELGVTVSQSKFHIGESVNFVGYKISADGIRSSDKNLESIRNFPIPTCVKDVRAFLGSGESTHALFPRSDAKYCKHKASLKEREHFCVGRSTAGGLRARQENSSLKHRG